MVRFTRLASIFALCIVLVNCPSTPKPPASTAAAPAFGLGALGAADCAASGTDDNAASNSVARMRKATFIRAVARRNRLPSTRDAVPTAGTARIECGRKPGGPRRPGRPIAPATRSPTSARGWPVDTRSIDRSTACARCSYSFLPLYGNRPSTSSRTCWSYRYELRERPPPGVAALWLRVWRETRMRIDTTGRFMG